MDGVFPTPMVVGRVSQDAGDGADDVICFLGFEKGAVAAIVEDDEHAHHECTREHRQRNSQPPRDVSGQIHQDPECKERGDGVDHLPGGARDGGLLITRYDLFPHGSISLLCAVGRC